MRQDGLVDRNM